ncbi:hypothetical protein [Pseudocitrobacter faecalis]|uniref:hypothetical protein n=1 Tax=Pseudocitrobacter faecalis TaxID=1398493 RepID=UPI003314DF72
MQTEQIQARGKTWQSLQSAVAITSLLVFLLACALMNKHVAIPVIAGVTAVLYFASTAAFWLKKSSARSGLIIFLCSMVFILATNNLQGIALPAIFSRYFDVILLLVGIALLRHVMASLNFTAVLGAYFSRKKTSNLTFWVTLLTAFLTWPMSLGAISLLLDGLKSVLGPGRNLAKIITRTVCITMVLMPTTIGAATVWAAMPDVPHVKAMLVGIPLFLFSILLNQRAKVTVITENETLKPNRDGMRYILLCVGLFWGGFIFSLTALNLNSLQSIAFTAVVLFVVDHLVKKDRSWAEQLTETAQNISGEVLLLLSCSVLTSVCWLLFAHVPAGITAYVGGLTTFEIYAIILFIVPLFGLLGIHPLIIFSVSWSIFSDYLTGGMVDYQIWICLFIATQLISPVSINAIFAANSLNVSPSNTSFKMHYGYVLSFNLFALVYLGAMSTII